MKKKIKEIELVDLRKQFDLNNYKRITPVILSELVQNKSNHMEYIIRLYKLENYICYCFKGTTVDMKEVFDLMVKYDNSIKLKNDLIRRIICLEQQIHNKDELINKLLDKKLEAVNERTE